MVELQSISIALAISGGKLSNQISFLPPTLPSLAKA
jgi:hypothetical protein